MAGIVGFGVPGFIIYRVTVQSGTGVFCLCINDRAISFKLPANNTAKNNNNSRLFDITSRDRIRILER